MLGTSVYSLGLWFQDAGSSWSTNTTLLTVFVGLVALAMVTQAIVVAVLAMGLMKAQKRMMSVVEELRHKAMPVIDSAQELMRDALPKVKVISTNVVETSHIVRKKVQEFETTLADVNRTVVDANQKTRGQISRVDGMVSSALQATSDLGSSIHHSIQVPVKQVAGVVAGLKSGLDVLLSQAKGYSGYRSRNP